MSPTLDYRLKGAFSLLANDPDNPCLVNVLIYLILHKNSRGRCWISTESIAQNATRSDPNKAVHAKQWLIEHDAIKLVPYEKRTGEERKLPKRQHIFQLTGFIRDGNTIYPYLYLNDSDLEEFKKAAEDIAGDIINQVHAKPRAKRIRSKNFIAHKAANSRNLNQSNNVFNNEQSINQVTSINKVIDGQIRDVYNMDVPNQSISNLSNNTTYVNFQKNENPQSQNTQNSDQRSQTPIGISGSSVATSSDYFKESLMATTYPNGENSTSLVLQNNNLRNNDIINVFVDEKGDAVLDPSLTLISPNGATTYICPSCRSYTTPEPNMLCLKCRNAGVRVDVKTLAELTKNADTIDGKYSKKLKEQVRAVQFAIMRNWPGMSQAFGWAGKTAQMLVGVASKNSGEYYTYRLREAATPEEVTRFAAWWKKTKNSYGNRVMDLPSSAEALEKFFSEFRSYEAEQLRKKEETTRKYIDIDLSNYR